MKNNTLYVTFSNDSVADYDLSKTDFHITKELVEDILLVGEGRTGLYDNCIESIEVSRCDKAIHLDEESFLNVRSDSIYSAIFHTPVVLHKCCYFPYINLSRLKLPIGSIIHPVGSIDSPYSVETLRNMGTSACAYIGCGLMRCSPDFEIYCDCDKYMCPIDILEQLHT